jgi:hypothetical protein
VLARIGKAWAAEFEVTGLGRNPDAVAMKIAGVDIGPHFVSPTLDAIDAKIDNLEALLTEHRKGEERRYPDNFQIGDWVQFPPQKSWRQIDHVGESPLSTDMEVAYQYGGHIYTNRVRAATRYPYCTAAHFAEVCDR